MITKLDVSDRGFARSAVHGPTLRADKGSPYGCQ